jgi:hypothetical protein
VAPASIVTYALIELKNWFDHFGEGRFSYIHGSHANGMTYHSNGKCNPFRLFSAKVGTSRDEIESDTVI